MKVGELEKVIKNLLSIGLTYKEKEYVWETFKVKQYLEDNPDNLNERVVSLQALLNAKKQSRLKRINELISMEADDE